MVLHTEICSQAPFTVTAFRNILTNSHYNYCLQTSSLYNYCLQKYTHELPLQLYTACRNVLTSSFYNYCLVIHFGTFFFVNTLIHQRTRLVVPVYNPIIIIITADLDMDPKVDYL